MDIKNLETFMMVAELKSFTQAAQRLGYTQSTVSFQIKQLEEELSAPLFERINHSVSLTNEGEKLIPIAHGIIKLSSEATHISGNSEDPHGTVRIATAESLCNWQFRNSFLDFTRKYPGIRLKLVSGNTYDMLGLLAQNQVDIAYILDKNLVTNKHKLVYERNVKMRFVTRYDQPIASCSELTIEDILSYPLLLTEKDMSYRALLDEFLARRDKETAPILEVGDTHLILELLMQGAGISFLPEFILSPFVEQGVLKYLNVSDIDIEIQIQLMYLKNKWVSPEMQCVIDFLKISPDDTEH